MMRLDNRRLITAACALCLASLAIMSWAVIDPRPLVVIAAMSVGQGLGILGVIAFLLVVMRDMWTRLRAPRESKPPPAPG